MEKELTKHVRVSTRIRNLTNNELIDSIFNQVKNQDFLKEPFKYDMVIEKLTIDASQFGIMAFGFDPSFTNNYNPDKYRITLRHAGVDYSVSVPYIRHDYIYSENLRIIYTVQQFTDMVNQAFIDCFALVPGSATSTSPPFVVFNNQSETLKLRVQTTYATNQTPPVDIEIFVNYTLYTDFFQGFNGIQGENNKFLGDKYFKFTIPENQNTVYIPNALNTLPPQPVGASNWILQIEQQWTSYYNLYDVESVVIKTGMMPASKTLISENDTGGNVINEPILTSFTISQFGTPESNTKIVYLPSPSYRRIPMSSDTSLRTINYSINFVSRYGTTIPFQLAPQQFLQMDLLFIRKDTPL